MTYAIIIAGNSVGFYEEAKKFRSFLKRNCGISASIVRTAYLTVGKLRARLQKLFLEHENEPLLLLYAGHGLKNGWAMCDEQTFPYEELAALFALRKYPSVFVNDCCFAGVAYAVFKEFGLKFSSLEILAAVDKSHECFAGLLDSLQESWAASKNYEPKAVFFKKSQKSPSIFVFQERKGAKLQYLFFKKNLN